MFVFNSWMFVSIAPQVTLPRMTAGETCTVAQALKTSHDAQPRGVVPQPVTRCLHRLTAACDTLGQGGNRQLRRAQAKAEQKSRGARRRVDYNTCQRAWTALFDQVGVWRTTGAVRRLTPDQQAALDHVLPVKGPDFDLRSRNRALWNTGSALLGHMTSNGLDDVFVTLGGAEVLAHVRRTHDDLGAALGVSSPMAAPVSQGPTVAAPLAVVQERLREYVVKVYALLDAEVEGSDAIVGALLAPLFDVAESRAQKSAATKRAKKTATKTAAPTTVVTSSSTPANDVTPAQRPTGTG